MGEGDQEVQASSHKISHVDKLYSTGNTTSNGDCMVTDGK